MVNLPATLDRLPALIERERAALAELVDPESIAQAERRAAAIVELARRAKLAAPIVNEATFLRAEALERLAIVVGEAQEIGEIEAHGGDRRSDSRSDGRTLNDLNLDKRRLAEGRALLRTGAISTIRDNPDRNPDQLISMNELLKQAERREREDALRKDRAEREAAARAALEHDQHRAALVVADITTWRPTGVHAIITDPPYIGANVLQLYTALRDFAIDVLPLGGALVVMTWQPILPGVLRALNHDELAFRWVIAWRFGTHANTVDHNRRVFDKWKPVLVYHRGQMPADAPMFVDELVSDRGDKLSHEWGQSLPGFEKLVERFSHPGELVCDPFLGGGTTAVAAIAQTRRFVGADIDAAAVRTAGERLGIITEGG